MHLSLALLVLLFSLILSNVINRVFPRLPLPLIQIIFGVGIGFLLKGRAFELKQNFPSFHYCSLAVSGG